MKYESELRFLRDTLAKCRLRVTRLAPGQEIDSRGEEDLYHAGAAWRSDRLLREFLARMEPAVLYKVTDRLRCGFLCLRLPEPTEKPVLLIGPYLGMELTTAQMLDCAERCGVSPSQFRMLEKFYAAIPVFSADSPAFAMVLTFCERLWGENYATKDLDRLDADWVNPFPVGEMSPEPDKTGLDMRLMEQRYAYENELMQAVSMGLSHKAEQIMRAFDVQSFEQRSSDPVRNLKNYSIIMNTLLRKAAEDGGVHPLYLDRVSSGFAHRIEALTSAEAVRRLMTEMFRAYCRLVKNHSLKHYSPPVQRAVIRIDSDLSGDLSLKALAEQQNINASYLSTLFRRETGQTITDFVNQRRVQLARKLLSTTQLQVQTVARYCGIPDVNYFSKLFRRYTGCTPKEYRKSALDGKTVAGE